MRRSKYENNGGFEAEKLQKLKEPYLSGAYIRSFVKQLASSSRTKDSSDLKEHGSLEREGNISRAQDLPGNIPSDKQRKAHHHPPQQHKKQVRRRLHTRKPYQEKLLNMAEARREIVSALKLHRAAMKQACSEKQHPQPVIESGPGPDFQPHQQFSSEQEAAKLKSRRNPRIYASDSYTSDKFPVNYVDNNIAYLPGFYNSPYSWSVPSIAPPPLFQENLDFALPSQTLGLNLNLQDFTNLENPSSIYSSSSPSTSSSPPLSAAAEEIPFLGAPTSAAGMAGIRSIGDQNQIGRFKFLKSMEIGPEDQKDEDFVSSPFDEVMEFPAWLNANESCLQHVNDFCTEDYFQDPALPW